MILTGLNPPLAQCHKFGFDATEGQCAESERNQASRDEIDQESGDSPAPEFHS